MSRSLKIKYISTSLLVAPAALMLYAATPALANCSVTAGTGTTAVPVNGDTITCVTAGGNHATRIGNGGDGVAATVALEDNAVISFAGTTSTVLIDDVTVTLGANAQLRSTNTAYVGNHGIYARSLTATSNATATLSGDSAQISTAGKYSFGVSARRTGAGDANTTAVLSGDNTDISAGQAGVSTRTVTGDATTIVTLSGDDTSIITTRGYLGVSSAVYSIATSSGNARVVATLSGDNALLQGSALGIAALSTTGDASLDVTLGLNTSVISTNGVGIQASGGAIGNPSSIIDSAGLIQAGSNSILLDDGNDTLILRTGSNLSSTNANMGAGTDTLTLIGNGTENEIFLNAETLDVDADATGWSLTGVSTFDDVNINSGLFTHNAANLTVNNNVAINSGGTLSGAGTFNNDVIINGGTLNGGLTLNGNLTINNSGIWNGADVLTGNTAVNSGGALSHTGTATGNVDINSGGLWNGTGTVAGNVTNAGIVAPGNSIGTQTIIGNFVQGAGGALNIEYDNLGNVDLLDITGGATIDGTVNFTQFGTGALTDGQTYDFIQTTTGVAGAFSTITDDLTFMDFTVGTFGNNVRATANLAVPATSSAQTQSETIIEDAINDLITGGNAGGLSATLLGLNTTQQIQNMLATQTSAINTSAVSSGLTSIGQSSGVVMSRLDKAASASSFASISPATGGNTEEAANSLGINESALRNILEKNEGSWWVELIGGFGEVSSDTSSMGMDYTAYGAVMGGEAYLKNDVTVGGYGSISFAESDLKDLNDTSETRTYQIGAYGSAHNEDWRYQGTISTAYMDFETKRPTINGTAQGDFQGVGLFLQGQATYDPKHYKNPIYPIAGFEGALFYHESYNEKGAGGLNLSIRSDVTSSFKTLFGFGTRKSFGIGNTEDDTKLILQPSAHILWAHEYLDRTSSVNGRFLTSPGTNFQTNGVKKDRNALRVKVEISARNPAHERINIYTAYEGNIATDHRDHKGTIGFKWKW